jgi:hypothetical protein
MCAGLVASGPQDTMTTSKKKPAAAPKPAATRKRPTVATLPGGASI